MQPCIYQILEYISDANSETLSCSACDHGSVLQKEARDSTVAIIWGLSVYITYERQWRVRKQLKDEFCSKMRYPSF